MGRQVLFWYTHAMNAFKDTIAWYDRHAKEFAATRKTAGSMYSVMEDFEKMLPKDAKILDAGCGVGQDTEHFSQDGFDVTGVDLSTGLIEEAKKLYPSGKFLVGDLRRLTFRENDFDAVWANASLLHFETRKDVLKSLHEFNRVLKDKGILYVQVKLRQGKDKTGMEKDDRYDKPRFFQYFTEEELRGLFRESGFLVVLSRIEQSKSRANVKWIQMIGRKVR